MPNNPPWHKEKSREPRLKSDPLRALHVLTEWAIRNDVAVEGLTVSQASLEDVYLRLTRPPAVTIWRSRRAVPACRVTRGEGCFPW